MTCKNCGTNYEGNSCPNGCNTQGNNKAKKPIYKKWWFWAIIAVVVIAIAGGGGEEDTPVTEDPTVTNSAASDIQNDTASTAATETQNTSNIYNPGDVINANGLKITYVKAEKYEEENMFMQPDDGYMYIRLYLSVDNTSSTDKYISSFEFTCYADGKKEESHYTSNEALEGGTLSSGRKDEGYIYFMVPVDAEQIEVEYETSFWTDKKAILNVTLN